MSGQADLPPRSDRQHFGALAEQYAPRLRGFLTSFADDSDHLGDLEQRTWTRVWAGRRGFTGGSFWGWLRAVAWSVALDDRRASIRFRKAKAGLGREQGRSLTIPAGPGQVERSELRLVLETAIQETLTPREREVVTLRLLEDWPPRDTADHLGITSSAMRSHLANGLKKLRAVLEEHRNDFT